MKSKSKTYFFLKLLRARIYAVGYAIIRHTSVVTIAKAKLSKSVPRVLVLVKKSVKFLNVNLPSPLVKA